MGGWGGVGGGGNFPKAPAHKLTVGWCSAVGSWGELVARCGDWGPGSAWRETAVPAACIPGKRDAAELYVCAWGGGRGGTGVPARPVPRGRCSTQEAVWSTESISPMLKEQTVTLDGLVGGGRQAPHRQPPRCSACVSSFRAHKMLSLECRFSEGCRGSLIPDLCLKAWSYESVSISITGPD